MLKKYSCQLMVAMVLWLFAGMALSEEQDATIFPQKLLNSNEPLELNADSLDYDYQKERSIYRGNVEIRNGDLYFSGDVAEMFVKESTFARVRLEGSPAVMRRESKKGRTNINVRAGVIDYDNTQRIVRMHDNVVVHHAGNVFRGDYVVYDVDKQLVQAPKQKNNRVRLTIKPQKSAN
ncbi:MAG: lipopolysaccharide transport periplasmic protein LptA [Candidatus Oxydemutatoraceae bacterium WSBS_2016_MAG_OTU14]